MTMRYVGGEKLLLQYLDIHQNQDFPNKEKYREDE